MKVVNHSINRTKLELKLNGNNETLKTLLLLIEPNWN